MAQPSNDGDMTLWILEGLIAALSKHQEQLPWTISESLSTVAKDHLTPESREALDAAQRWVWYRFTEKAPPG